MAYRMIRKNRIARLMARTRKAAGGCWEWQGCRSQGGYGVSRLNGKAMGAHRVAYLLLRGNIPPGKDLDHLCRNRICVNPDHLEPVTRRENLMRGVEARGCVNGHPYSEDTWGLVRRSNGTTERRCKVCHRERNKKSKRKLRAQQKEAAQW